MANTVTDTQYQYVCDDGADGSLVGTTTSSKIGFFGKTPVSQPTGSTQAAAATTAVTTAATTDGTVTNHWGFATSTQANNVAARVVANTTLLNQLRTDLVNLGIIKGSA